MSNVGWQCPQCKVIYSPQSKFCVPCSKKHKTPEGVLGLNILIVEEDDLPRFMPKMPSLKRDLEHQEPITLDEILGDEED